MDRTRSCTVNLFQVESPLVRPREEAASFDVASSYRLCRDIAKQHSKTFYFASLFLNEEKRAAIWAIYAFCRTADDTIDTDAPPQLRLSAIDELREDVIAAFNGRPRDGMMIAFADAVRRFGVPIEPALALLQGARRDVTVNRYETYEELREYCYLVASTVGLLTSPVLGYEEGALPYGIALGRAMQMTNILRDVGEDARMGRIYLPAEEIRRFGYSEHRLLAGTIDESFIALMKFQIRRVRALYDEAAPGIDLLARESRYTVRLALSLYRRILDEIERRDYDVFTRRAFVSLRTKITTAMLAAFPA